MKHERKQLLTVRWILGGLTVSVVLIGIVAAALATSFAGPPDERPIAFNSAIWKATPSEFSHRSIRQRMVDDLLRKHPLVGCSRAQIESLIGPADDTAYFKLYDMVYGLGAERSSYLQVDSEWLVIKLDEAGKAIEVRLVTD